MTLRLPLVLALALVGGLPARSRPAPPVSRPASPVRVAELEVLDVPSNYLPLKDGRVVLLDNVGKRLKVVRDGAVVGDVALTGEGFRADATNLVDLAEAPEGGLLVLDSLGGTVWRVGLDGRVSGHFGLFVGATRIAVGADGRVYVRDPVNTCVTGFEGGAAVTSFPSPLPTAPFASRDGRVPYVRRGESGKRTRVGLLRHRPRKDAAPEVLQTLTPRAGLELYATTLVGVRGDHLYASAASWDPDRDQDPRAVDLWVLSTRGGPTRRVRVPRLRNHCWDCGPEFRLGPEGDLWFFHLTGGHSHDHHDDDEGLVYRVYRMPLGRGDR